jgi:D-alanyl-D-alanine dipeptidase
MEKNMRTNIVEGNRHPELREASSSFLEEYNISPSSEIASSTQRSLRNDIPKEFVYLSQFAPDIQQSVRYATVNNFLARPAKGYLAEEIIITRKAAEKLVQIQRELKRQGFELVIYDGYRPQKAVEDFYEWSSSESDQVAKKIYYPQIEKNILFDIGFISRKSSHTRGSTVDLTLIEVGKKLSKIQILQRELVDGTFIPFLDDGTMDMGSSFDLFHEVSYHDTSLVTLTHLKNRALLKEMMIEHGFAPYSKEWWHYAMKDEPFPDSYFNFDIGAKS